MSGMRKAGSAGFALPSLFTSNPLGGVEYGEG